MNKNKLLIIAGISLTVLFAGGILLTSIGNSNTRNKPQKTAAQQVIDVNANKNPTPKADANGKKTVNYKDESKLSQEEQIFYAYYPNKSFPKICVEDEKNIDSIFYLTLREIKQYVQDNLSKLGDNSTSIVDYEPTLKASLLMLQNTESAIEDYKKINPGSKADTINEYYNKIQSELNSQESDIGKIKKEKYMSSTAFVEKHSKTLINYDDTLNDMRLELDLKDLTDDDVKVVDFENYIKNLLDKNTAYN